MKRQLTILLLLLSVVILHAAAPAGYYDDAEGKTGSALKSALHDIIDGNKKLSYDDVWEALMYTDEDPDNTNNVILLYSGWSYPKSNKGGNTTQWNREHTWAKSKGDFGTSQGPGTDIHHLRPTDVTINSARGSMPFDEGGSLYTDASRYGGGSGATECKKGGNNWEPADEVKGDVARMLFYMDTRYEGKSGDGYDLELAEYSTSDGKHGKLSVLLKWHAEDPVSAWEVRRNNRIEEKQGNRNPFIDHPEYVNMIWGDGTPGDSTTVEPDEPNQSKNILNLTFDTGFDGCKVFQLSDTVSWIRSTYKEKAYAYINTYGKGVNESWLVTPTLNLDTLSNETFSFCVSSYNADKTIAACGAGQFELYYSTSFNGTSIDKTEWTRITEVDDITLGAKWDFVAADIDVSHIAGTKVNFAFAHKSNASNGTTWEVDDVKLTGESNNTTEPDSKPDSDPEVQNSLDLTFDNDLDGCEVLQVNGETEWEYSYYEDKAAYAKINTYGKGANESWLVTPAVNMDKTSKDILSFSVASYNSDKTIAACGAGQFELYYSTSFNGTSIDKTEWTRIEEVDDVMLVDRWDFVNKSIDVSHIAGTKVNFAFAHKSNASNGTTWELDNVKLSGETGSSVLDVSKDLVQLYPNPSSHHVVLSAAADVVEVWSLAGSVVMQMNKVAAGQSIDISGLQAGIYFVKLTMANKTQTVRLIKK